MSSRVQIAIAAAGMLFGLAYGYTRSPPPPSQAEAQRILAAVTEVAGPQRSAPAGAAPKLARPSCALSGAGPAMGG